MRRDGGVKKCGVGVRKYVGVWGEGAKKWREWENMGEVWESVLGVGESEKRCGNGGEVWGCKEVWGEVWGSVRGGVGCVGKCVGVWEKCWGRCRVCGKVCWGVGKCWGRSGKVC